MLVGAVVVTSMVVASESAQQAKLGCQDSCYDLTIPYPFGSTESCYYDRNFLITCKKTLAKPFLWRVSESDDSPALSSVLMRSGSRAGHHVGATGWAEDQRSQLGFLEVDLFFLVQGYDLSLAATINFKNHVRERSSSAQPVALISSAEKEKIKLKSSYHALVPYSSPITAQGSRIGHRNPIRWSALLSELISRLERVVETTTFFKDHMGEWMAEFENFMEGRRWSDGLAEEMRAAICDNITLCLERQGEEDEEDLRYRVHWVLILLNWVREGGDAWGGTDRVEGCVCGW
ncbi:hypothetical protein Vadar_023882 [Vaccinium darrowii]|uniref:Uncharacterized protein n=1 Tax=Vaccinium darrowii TaxID=229202 RepID=A0ACB7Y8E9_9ERIC|nr:hypothetical protein Vadar_023882 [Vaccinium darrowii]